MDRKGHLPGGQVSEIMNVHSRKIYMISTAPEIGQDYWSTSVLPVVTRSFLFGLIRKNVPDAYHQLGSFIRNGMKDAYEAHARVRHIVASIPEGDWSANFPSHAPPDGYSEGARKKLNDHFGDTLDGKPSEGADLVEALKIVSAYGEVMEREQSIVMSESNLPVSKERIRQSIIVLQSALRDAASRAMLAKLLTPQQAQGVLSPQFEQVLGTGLVLLDSFVPESEARRSAQEWNEMLALRDKIAKTMTPEQIAEAKSLAREPKPK